MKELLSKGADINYINPFTSFTPLHLAIENKMDISIIQFLLSNDANPHIEDK